MTKIGIILGDGEFKKELNSQRARHGGSETNLTLTLDSQERNAYSVQKQLVLQTPNIEKQDKFRSDQTLRVKKIQLATQKLNDATASSDIKQKAIHLLRLLQFETRGQTIEIIEFARTKRINNALYDEHKRFLWRLNGQLRKVTHNFMEKFKANIDHEVGVLIDQLVADLASCFDVLDGRHGQQDPAEYHANRQVGNGVAEDALKRMEEEDNKTDRKKQQEKYLAKTLDQARLAIHGD